MSEGKRLFFKRKRNGTLSWILRIFFVLITMALLFFIEASIGM